MGNSQMLAGSLIGPEEDGLLKSAIKAAEIDIQKHRHGADAAGLAELKEVVFEELVAGHEVAPTRDKIRVDKGKDGLK